METKGTKAIAILQKLVNTFPEFDTDEQIDGSDAVDVLASMWEEIKEVVSDNVQTIIEHFENGVRIYTTSKELIAFSQNVFDENEEPDSHLIKPQTYSEAITYIEKYCDNFRIILPIGTKVICWSDVDVIVGHVDPTDTENYNLGYRYILQHRGLQGNVTKFE